MSGARRWPGDGLTPAKGNQAGGAPRVKRQWTDPGVSFVPGQGTRPEDEKVKRVMELRESKGKRLTGREH